MIINKVPKSELACRLERFMREMDATYPAWEICAVTGSMSMYHLTGTICDGLLLIRRNQGSVLWVRRSYERSILESDFPDIRPMKNFRDLASQLASAGSHLPDTLYLDTAQATLEWHGLFSKHIPFTNILPADKVLLQARAVKSAYELDRIKRSGALAEHMLIEHLPKMINDTTTEATAVADLYALCVRNGHHGVSRFSMKNTDVTLGHICFGDNSLYPSVFNGASGSPGYSPAVPTLGSPVRTACAGDLIYADISLCVEGYHSDKTLIYSYKTGQPENVVAAHTHCLELQRHAAALLRPGAKPSEIYREVINMVLPEYKHCFMGAPNRTVPFIGHGVGLYIDELPIIARGFDAPLESGMTIALEPKIGLEGIGMVGSENTYLVTESGGISLTGECMEIIVI